MSRIGSAYGLGVLPGCQVIVVEKNASPPESAGDFLFQCDSDSLFFFRSSEVEMQFIECQAGDSVIIDNRTEVQVLSVIGDEVTVAIISPDEEYREETLVLCAEHELAGAASS